MKLVIELPDGEIPNPDQLRETVSEMVDHFIAEHAGVPESS